MSLGYQNLIPSSRGEGEHIRGIAIELSFGRRLSLGGIISVGFRRGFCVFDRD